MKLYTLFTVFASEKDEKQNKHFGRVYFDEVNNENFRELSPLALKIYISILEYADWKTGKCWPRQTTLAENCGCKRETVNRKIKELIKHGYVRKEYESKIPVYYIIAYAEQKVEKVVEVRNIMAEDGVLGRKPYTDEEKEEIYQETMENYPETDQEKRQKILYYSKGEFDMEKIMEELKEAESEEERKREQTEEKEEQPKSKMDEITEQVKEYRQSLSEDELEQYKRKAHEFLTMQGYPEGYRLKEIVDGAINTLIQQELGLDEEESKSD